MTLLFEDPPEDDQRRGEWGIHRRHAAQLRQQPGQWAVVGIYRTSRSSGSLAYQIRKGSLPAYAPAGAFEARACTVDGEHRVYVRFVGHLAPGGDGDV